jgi:hypothetical protein
MTLSLADLQRIAGATGFRSETLEAPGNERVDRVRKLGLYLGAGPTKPS